ncbi:MAG: exopolysaccharide biosynthesis polyprenyl glycosylphosphotransferase [Ruminococcus sp.]|nr:exopolysaccharide biosynthesis polyprenyl glycosylphosphotransferase [Ruminococcus sp.]
MVNKEQFKRLIVTVATLVIVCCMAFCFIFVWHNLYNTNFGEKIGEDYFFWQRGNVLLLVIYMLLYMAFTKSFNGFRVGYLKTAGLIGSQILGIISTNAVTYLLISLMGRSLVDPVPLLMLTAYQFLLAAIWVTGATYVYLKIYPPRKMIIVYGNTNARDLVTKMSERVDKYMICSSVSISEDLETIKEKILDFEAVIICDVPSNLRNQLLKFTYDKSIRTYITPKISDVILRGSEEIHLFDTPLLLSRNLGLTFEQRVIKRLMDLAMAVICSVIALPFMLITALAIKLYDKGPVLYSQERLTLDGKVFKVYKFRSMIVDAEKDGVARLAKDNDSRITPVGKIIRKIRFDELPQLINILKGDMSFVGPRPERPEIAKQYEETIPEFRYRLKAKAGLTGYAQVMGKYNTTPYDKLKLDLMYIEQQSIILDIRILLLTIKTIFVPDSTEGVTNDTAATDSHKLTPKSEMENKEEISV